jgi:hypothetical protein
VILSDVCCCAVLCAGVTAAPDNREDDDMMVVEDVSFTSDHGGNASIDRGRGSGGSVPTNPSRAAEASRGGGGGAWASAAPAAPAPAPAGQAVRGAPAGGGGQKKSLVVDMADMTRSATLSQARPDSVNSFNSFDDSDSEPAVTANKSAAVMSVHDLKKIFHNSITAPGAEHAQKQ